MYNLTALIKTADKPKQIQLTSSSTIYHPIVFISVSVTNNPDSNLDLFTVNGILEDKFLPILF